MYINGYVSLRADIEELCFARNANDIFKSVKSICAVQQKNVQLWSDITRPFEKCFQLAPQSLLHSLHRAVGENSRAYLEFKITLKKVT
jgi:hypothetical protein